MAITVASVDTAVAAAIVTLVPAIVRLASDDRRDREPIVAAGGYQLRVNLVSHLATADPAQAKRVLQIEVARHALVTSEAAERTFRTVTAALELKTGFLDRPWWQAIQSGGADCFEQVIEDPAVVEDLAIVGRVMSYTVQAELWMSLA